MKILFSIVLLLSSIASGFGRVLGMGSLPRVLIAANGAPPNLSRDGSFRRVAEEDITRHLILAKGIADRGVVIADADDEPFYVAQDTADDGSGLAVDALGATQGTLHMIADASITSNADAYLADGGKVVPQPTTAGTYHMVGKVKEGGAQDDPIEVIPCKPVRVVILASDADIAALRAAATEPSQVMFLSA
ncbi:MAG: hypothetical protein JJT75_15105 [Opitutales bacterium]|nr:hypothetical protein [Opitutales bacterium]